jgi:hypothetical protein
VQVNIAVSEAAASSFVIRRTAFDVGIGTPPIDRSFANSDPGWSAVTVTQSRAIRRRAFPPEYAQDKSGMKALSIANVSAFMDNSPAAIRPGKQDNAAGKGGGSYS